MLGLQTSAKAWSGGLTAAAFSEYVKPTLDYFLGIGLDKLDNWTGVPIPEGMASGLSALAMFGLVGLVIHLVPNAEKLPKADDPGNSAGA